MIGSGEKLTGEELLVIVAGNGNDSAIVPALPGARLEGDRCRKRNRSSC